MIHLLLQEAESKSSITKQWWLEKLDGIAMLDFRLNTDIEDFSTVCAKDVTQHNKDCPCECGSLKAGLLIHSDWCPLTIIE